jgi:predicted protein tyrosine phosphatase
MTHMNDYDLDYAVQRFTRATKPNRLALALVVRNLAEQTNLVSDGWAYWPKPSRAAQRAMALIESTTSRVNDAQEREDITDAEMHAAVRPIKAFLTRHRDAYTAEQRALILRAVEEG